MRPLPLITKVIAVMDGESVGAPAEATNTISVEIATTDGIQFLHFSEEAALAFVRELSYHLKERGLDVDRRDELDR